MRFYFIADGVEDAALERAAEEFADVIQYALQIGCTIVMDEIVCHTEEQERLLLARWEEWK